MHKEFKCLDIFTGRIYISRDVIFDESVFPFASLNSNAGARYTSDVLFIPSSTPGDNIFTNESNDPTISALSFPDIHVQLQQGSVMIDVQAPVPDSNVASGSTHVPSAPDNALPGAPNHMIPSLAPTVSHAANPQLMSPVVNSALDESASAAVPMISASTDLPPPRRIFLGPCVGIICGQQAPTPSPAPPRTRLQARIRKPKTYTDDTVRYSFLYTAGEPCNLQETLSTPHWKAAMEDEYHALFRNKIWKLVPPQASRNIINCKWVYKVKQKANGSMDCHKA
jgi:hypothetical protein